MGNTVTTKSLYEGNKTADNIAKKILSDALTFDGSVKINTPPQQPVETVKQPKAKIPVPSLVVGAVAEAMASGMRAKIDKETTVFKKLNSVLLSQVEEIIGVSSDGFVSNLKAESIKLNIPSKYQDIFMRGALKSFIKIMEARVSGKETNVALENKSLIKAGKQAVDLFVAEQIAKSAIMTKIGTVVDSISKTLSEATIISKFKTKNPEAFKSLSNYCTLNSVDPNEVLGNAVTAAKGYFNKGAKQKFLESYVKGYIEKFNLMASKKGQISPEMLSTQNPELTLAGKTAHMEAISAEGVRTSVEAKKSDKSF